MIPYFPRQIALKGIYLYLGSLAAVSLLFMKFAMQPVFIAIGIVWVLLFFLLSHVCSKEWAEIGEKKFTLYLFFSALGVRTVWLLFSYVFYTNRTGMPFEFSAADSLWYYSESMGYRHARILDSWNYLFRNTESVSDSGYVFYLAVLGKLTGESIILPRLVNAALNSYAAVLTYRVGRTNVGEEAGRLAGIFFAFMPNLIFYCGLHLKEAMMIFLVVAFLERADHLLRSRHYTVWTIAVPAVLALTLFSLRTVLGASAIFAFATALVFSSTKVVGRKKKIMLIGWGLLAATTLTGGVIVNEAQELWETRNENQDAKRHVQTVRGNRWAKYATGTVLAPMMFVMPFPTMVDVDNQYNQQTVSGGNFVRNFLGCFVLITLFDCIFITKNWRNLSLLGAYAIAYLGIISASAFANSERFLLPALPVLLIMAANGITCLNRKYYLFVKLWYWIVPVMVVGWAVFKLGSRALL